MASGLNISTPAIKASVPPAISTTWSVVALPPETLLPVARQTTPPTTKAAATRAERSSAAGRGGRPDRATTGGMRDMVRPGHHAAPVAVTTARKMPTRSSHQGTWNASMRKPSGPSMRGATTNQVPKPRTPPTTPATRPVAAPVATIVSRRCFSVAPTAAIIPSCGRRRCAMTAKLAAAMSAIRNITTVLTTRVVIEATRLSGTLPLEATIRPVSPGGRNDSTRDSLAFTIIWTSSDWASADGGNSTNLSPRSLGFSTFPTTVRATPSRSIVEPILAPSVAATQSDTATSPSAVG